MWVVNVTPDPLYAHKETLYPLYRWLGGPQCRSGRVRKITLPPGFDPRTTQPVACRYTAYVILTHLASTFRSPNFVFFPFRFSTSVFYKFIDSHPPPILATFLTTLGFTTQVGLGQEWGLEVMKLAFLHFSSYFDYILTLTLQHFPHHFFHKQFLLVTIDKVSRPSVPKGMSWNWTHETHQTNTNIIHIARIYDSSVV
jgi:hypothetical protein